MESARALLLKAGVIRSRSVSTLLSEISLSATDASCSQGVFRPELNMLVSAWAATASAF